MGSNLKLQFYIDERKKLKNEYTKCETCDKLMLLFIFDVATKR